MIGAGWWDQVKWHWLGWILTALAISLGAPFWFDLLNKFIVIRSAVKPHEKSPEESSKTMNKHAVEFAHSADPEGKLRGEM